MKKYNVHFSGYYGYDVVVEANDPRKAIDIAKEYEPTDNDMYYEPESAGTEAIEVNQNARVTYRREDYYG